MLSLPTNLAFQPPPPVALEPQPLKVALIDDHVLFRQGLGAIIATQPDLCVVGEATEPRGLEGTLDRAQPHVVVIDVSLRGACGIAATREVLRRSRRSKVLILTTHASDELAAQCFAAGASGYALKDQDAAEVLAAIRQVAAGGRYLAPSIREMPGDPPKRHTPHTCVQELSRREREVFELAVAGRTNRGIADRLSISIKTVETHRASIYRKLDAHSTADLVRIAARHGIVPV
jgi:DNA-binding NarL/FixJ family response regulator